MTNEYKQYNRNRRQTTIEQDFSKGMMFNEGTVDFSYAKMLVNYTTYNDKTTLVPRSGLHLKGLVLPDYTAESFETPKNEAYFDTDISIKAVKECVESDGKTYKQFILGKATKGREGDLYVVTSLPSEVTYKSTVVEGLDVKLSLMDENPVVSKASYLVTDLNEIHGMPLKEDSRVSSLIGTFAFGNSYYFMNPSISKLCRTKFDDIKKNYVVEELNAKIPDPSEAVTYGYNMLLGSSAYDFKHSIYEGNLIQLTGILPYDSADSTTLLMTPKKNQDIKFKCFCKAPSNKQYKFKWEWRTLESDTWNLIEETETIAVLADTDLSVVFKPPATDIMIRVQAYNSSDLDTVEKAMTVGFDFSLDKENENITPEVYDLTSATGLVSWKNRLVLWGVEKDPSILFISDFNEPTYFPYPNNISVFDDPIVAVKPYMDDLLVFTTSQVYQVALNEEGTGWTSTLLQSNLYIQPWDRHLIQIVRNMVFFKSGNYYYMIVPKAQSMTGELTLAPVSTPIVEFFNNFSKNIEDMLKDVFDYSGLIDIVHYYNFLDYENIHNVYVLDYEGLTDNYLHLDLIYNTVTRSWKVYTFDAPHFLFPYRNDATQVGILATTSILNLQLSIASQNAFRQIEEPTEGKLYTNAIYLGTTLSKKKILSCDTIRIYYNLDDYIDFTVSNSTFEDGRYKFFSGEYGFSVPEDPEQYASLYLLNGDYTLKTTNGLMLEYITNGRSEISVCTSLFRTEEYVGYNFIKGSISLGSVLEKEGVKYHLDTIENGWLYDSTSPNEIMIKELGTGYVVSVKGIVGYDSAPIIKAYSVSDETSYVPARCLQLFEFNALNMNDIFLPANSEIIFDVDSIGDSIVGYSTGSISYSIMQLLGNLDDYIRFKNWQYLDTGFREDNLHLNKRYRELQLQLNNISGTDLEFNMEFNLNGHPKRCYYFYEVGQDVDSIDQEQGLVSIQASPLTEDSHKTNLWRLEQSDFSDVSLWKVRTHISGKGQAPRLKLLSRNVTRYELMGINWVYRIMNMR